MNYPVLRMRICIYEVEEARVKGALWVQLQDILEKAELGFPWKCDFHECRKAQRQ